MELLTESLFEHKALVLAKTFQLFELFDFDTFESF